MPKSRRISLPYNTSSIDAVVPEGCELTILEPRRSGLPLCHDEEAIIREALDNPIGSQPLEKLAKGKNRIVIITSDHTRPMPSRITMPLLLERIRQANPYADVTILIATGLHRPMTESEMSDRFGPDTCCRERIVNHISGDDSQMRYLGQLPSGSPLFINSLAADADLLISEGFIEPHFFAGFSGGRKSVLPGIASKRTVLGNHCARFVADPAATMGSIEGNPLHEDMVVAAKHASLAFILNVVLDDKKRIEHAVSGDFLKAHAAGCDYVRRKATIPSIQADIVITSNGGYPLDQNVYQSVKGMALAAKYAKPGGTIIQVSACVDGHGGEGFYRFMREASTPDELMRKIEAIPQEETLADQWEAQVLARILSRNEVILVSDMIDKRIVEDLMLTSARDLNEALELALKRQGACARVVVIPDGVSVLPDNKGEEE